MILTKSDKDRKIYTRFNALVADGYSKMQATEVVMKEFNVLSTMTIYNIRKRCGNF